MRVRSCVLLLSLLLTPGVSWPTAGPVPPGADEALTELRAAVQDHATVTAAAGAASGRHRAFGPAGAAATTTSKGVSIVLGNGPPLQLRNSDPKTDETLTVTYWVRGREPGTGLVWVTKTGWEYEHQLLVTRRGRMMYLANEPRLSPDGRWLFARQDDCFQVADDCEPGFELWRVEADGSLRLVKNVRLKNYFVAAGDWVAPGKLRLELGSIEQLMDTGEAARVPHLPFELTVQE